MFDFIKLKEKSKEPNRYKRQINRIKKEKKDPKNLEKVVEEALDNINEGKCSSFVIYGEPQSGKTEMMIALTSKLLDEGVKIVIILLNDDVELLKQNLERFGTSGIDPAPKHNRELLDSAVTIGDNEFIIFSKKNSKDLYKLIQKIGHIDRKVVIDDEADYATPNAKINKGEKTRINELVGKLIGQDGIYVGVTATPARLDLNNTYENENEYWIDFPPPPSYKGKDVFFPVSLDLTKLEFRLNLLPDTGDEPRFLREAIFSFLINVAYLNLTEIESNYSILIHTSGNTRDHSVDYKEAQKIFNDLKQNTSDSEKHYKSIYEVAKKRYSGKELDITQYIHDNCSRNTIIVLNSDPSKKAVSPESATRPSTLFTVIIGGNKVSRGVTFHNLLSMYFTRDVKHKIQQDTYIQRARMFGYREEYLQFFELHIPQALYLVWHKCFVFHRLSLIAIKSGKGAPVWIENKRISAVSSSSIDKTRVNFDKGEMSFGVFLRTPDIENILDGGGMNFKRLMSLAKILGNDCFPDYLLNYIESISGKEDKYIAIHPSTCIKGLKDANQELIERSRGFISTSALEKSKYPDAVHHFKIYYNSNNQAKLFYKYEGDIKFLQKQKTEV